MSNIQNESQLVSGFQNIENQVQNVVISQIYKMRQLTNFESQIQNQSFNQDEIDPRIQNKYLNLRNKIHFKNKEDEQEFFEIIIFWNQSLQLNQRLNQLIMEQSNQFIQNQSENEFQISKVHMIDYTDNEPLSSFSLLTSQDQTINNQVQKESSTQTEILNDKVDNIQQVDLREIDQDDTQNIKDFFNSNYYKDLKNKQFLIDAQLISLIQTIFLMYNERGININEPIKQQIDNLIQRIKKKDQISYNTIEILNKSVKI